MSGSYHTKQRSLVFDCVVKNAGQCVSAKEISAACAQSGTPVGLATIYRHLEKLAQQGKVKKVVTNDGAGVRFQYVPDAAEENVFYLKCDKCGQLTQMDCRLLQEVAEHMSEEHGFKIDAAKSVLYGRCQDCKD